MRNMGILLLRWDALQSSPPDSSLFFRIHTCLSSASVIFWLSEEHFGRNWAFVGKKRHEIATMMRWNRYEQSPDSQIVQCAHVK